MSSQPILRALERLEEEITHEEAIIQIAFMRINQIRENFMISHKALTININILKTRLRVSRQKIKDLKARKIIISTA